MSPAQRSSPQQSRLVTSARLVCTSSVLPSIFHCHCSTATATTSAFTASSVRRPPWYSLQMSSRSRSIFRRLGRGIPTRPTPYPVNVRTLLSARSPTHPGLSRHFYGIWYSFVFTSNFFFTVNIPLILILFFCSKIHWLVFWPGINFSVQLYFR